MTAAHASVLEQAQTLLTAAEQTENSDYTTRLTTCLLFGVLACISPLIKSSRIINSINPSLKFVLQWVMINCLHHATPSHQHQTFVCVSVCYALQWVMINRMIRLMWPKLTSAILLEVVKAVKPIVQQNLNAVSKKPFLSCMCHVLLHGIASTSIKSCNLFWRKACTCSSVCQQAG
jgi:hypothetical protein